MLTCPGCGEENPAKFRLCGYCGTALAPQASPAAVHEVRKTVTVVFSDLKGSTSLGEHLDAEALREVMDRYFAAMAAEIARHGGKIEKFIGDAIMAVFGLPRAHEDDALRAVRAAVGMREALGRVNADLATRYGVALANRTGVNTGEVVATDDPGAAQKLATGDAVNVAARLEQAAPENEIYIGETTYRLVRDAVEAEPVEPLELKGKAAKIPAFRLRAVQGLLGNARRIDTPIVGRVRELDALAATYREVCTTGSIRLVTVIGDAGVGKSRLVHEVVERIATDARVLVGRCLPYGEGITFWPLREMVCAAAGVRADDPPERARAKVLDAVGDGDVAERLAAAAGLSAASFPLAELYWAARRFLEAMAGASPVVAVIDDIHWAEPAFLDLLLHLLDAGTRSPVLLLATARHELIEEQPQWAERPAALRLILEPLSDGASAEVVANLLGDADLPADVVARIVAGSEGNPLFVEQMLSMLVETGAVHRDGGRWVRTERYADVTVPPTIQALLEARLDRLARDERATVEPAAVIGLQFALPAVEALAPPTVRPAIGSHLTVLTRKQFVERTASTEADAIFRFHHHLVRETVYGGLLKRTRAQLHIEFVRWADRVNADRDRALEFEELLGYHLEQARGYLAELGPLDAQGVAIGVDAAGRLARAGRRAFARSDMHAAANLYRRAAALLDADDAQRLALLPQLAEAQMELGEFAGARAVLAEATERAERIGDARLRDSARLVRMLVRLYSAEPGDWSSETLRVAGEALPALERAQAHNEIATAWRLIGFVHGVAGRYTKVVEAAGHLVRHARLAGNDRLVDRTVMGLASSALFGATPVAQAIVQCEGLIAEGLADRQVESSVMCTLAQLRAMNGEFDVARSLYRRGRAMLRDLGQGMRAAAAGIALARVELLAGGLADAEREVRADCEFLTGIGETYFFSTLAALLSRIVRDQGRDADALMVSRQAEAAAAADDIDAQVFWRSIRAPIVARGGDAVGAEALARGALELAIQTEDLVCRADALVELATVLSTVGRADEACRSLADAAALYELKGDVVSAARVGGQLGALREPGARSA